MIQNRRARAEAQTAGCWDYFVDEMRTARFLLLFIGLLSPLMCEARGGRGGGGRGGGRGGGSRGGLFRWGRSILTKKFLLRVKAGKTAVTLLFVAKMSFTSYEKK